MINEWLINIIEESSEANKDCPEAPKERTKEQSALSQINHWANELYEHSIKQQWFEKLEETFQHTWGGYPDEGVTYKQCRCWATLNFPYIGKEVWIDEHFLHDEGWQRQNRFREEQILKERYARRNPKPSWELDEDNLLSL